MGQSSDQGQEFLGHPELTHTSSCVLERSVKKATTFLQSSFASLPYASSFVLAWITNVASVSVAAKRISTCQINFRATKTPSTYDAIAHMQ